MQFSYEHLDWRELANRMMREGRIDELFRELMLATNGDVERALEHLGRLKIRSNLAMRSSTGGLFMTSTAKMS